MLPFFQSSTDYKDLQEWPTNLDIIQNGQSYHKKYWLREMKGLLSLPEEMNLQHEKKIRAFVHIKKIHLFIFPLSSRGKLPPGRETCHGINYLPVPSPGWHNHNRIHCATSLRETLWTEEQHFVQQGLYKMKTPAVVQTHHSDDSNTLRTTTVSALTWKAISPSHWCSCAAVLYIHFTTESLMKTDIARRIKEVKRFRWI